MKLLPSNGLSVSQSAVETSFLQEKQNNWASTFVNITQYITIIIRILLYGKFLFELNAKAQLLKNDSIYSIIVN